MTSFSPPFSLFGVGGFFFFPNCSHSLIFQVASGMRGASLRVPHLPRSSRFLPHYIFDTPRASQKEKMKHWSCERWTPAHFRNGETWVPEGYELHNQGTAWRKGEENLTNSPRPTLSGLRAPAPFGGWRHFSGLTDDKNHSGLVSNPGSSSDPRNQFTQGEAQESVYLGARFITSDKAGKQTNKHRVRRRRQSKDYKPGSYPELPRQLNWHQEPRGEETLGGTP